VTDGENQDKIILKRDDDIKGQNPTKRRKIIVVVKKDTDGLYDIDDEYEKS
jgi:hypothetical protein